MDCIKEAEKEGLGDSIQILSHERRIKRMNKRFGNLCYMYRHCANLTINQASELLDISPRTLSYYESGRNVPDDIVAKMVQIYNAPEIGYIYLAGTDTGKIIFTEQINTNTKGIACRVLNLNTALREVNKQHDILENICCDDVIDDTEKKTFKECIKKLTKLAVACINIKLFRQKKSRTDRTSTGFVKS